MTNCAKSDNYPSELKGPSSSILVSKSPIHGYGVFAFEDINAGQLIEESKLLRLGFREKYIIDPVLKDYMWVNRNCSCDECKNHGFVAFLGLGLVSIYNHSDQPNTNQIIDYGNEVFTLIAKQPILKGEEIFVSYGAKYFLIREFWKKINENKELEQVLLKNKIDQKIG